MAPKRSQTTFLGVSFLVTLAAIMAVAVAQFPDDEIPPLPALAIVGITPSADPVVGTSVEYPIHSRQPIQIIFNRAVIALGDDFENKDAPFTLSGSVPGQFRWVTTYIARFDPLVDWPTDLHITLTIDSDLTTFDGSRIQFTTDHPATYKFGTRTQNMALYDVTSASASAATDGDYSAFLPSLLASGAQSSLPEILADSVITVVFRSAVDATLLSQSLKLVETLNPTNSLPISVAPCSIVINGFRGCATVTLTAEGAANLVIERTYSLVLPSGSSYSTIAGPSTSKLQVDFIGPYNFLFSFVDSRIASFEATLALRRGLAAGVALSDIKNQIQLKEGNTAVSFELVQVSSFLLGIRYNFVPSTSYTFSVTASSAITDALGFALKASSITSKASGAASYFDGPNIGRLTLVEDTGAALDPFVYYSRNVNSNCQSNDPNKNTPYAFATAVTKSNIKKAFCLVYSTTPNNIASFPRDISIANPPSSGFSTASLDVASVLSTTGTAIVASRSYGCNYEAGFVSQSDFGISVVSTSDQTAFWLTRFETNTPVAGATVSLYSVNYPCENSDSTTVVASGVTDSNGLWKGSQSLSCSYYNVLVELDSKLLVFPQTYVPCTSNPGYKLSLVADRGVYRTLDAVYVEGYVRTNAYPITVPSNGETWTLSVDWNENSRKSYSITLDPTYGSFNLTLQVPSDATYGPIDLNFFCSKGCRGGGDSYSTTIVIADPRVPTVSLGLTASDLVFSPASGVSLTVNTATYVGTKVPNAALTFRWNVKNGEQTLNYYNDRYPSSEVVGNIFVAPPPTNSDGSINSGPQSGVDYYVTDSNGILTIDYFPTDLERIYQGDTFNLLVEWFGPTGELLQDTISLPVSYTDREIALSTSDLNPLPGFAFGVSADLRLVSGASVNGQSITIELREWNDAKTAIVFDPEDGSYSSSTSLGNVVTTCTALSNGGAAPICTFTLPTTGHFVLIASYQDGGYLVTSSLPIGQTEVEWNEHPLFTFPALYFAPDQQSYEIGDTATFSFYNPFSSGLLLVSFGNTGSNFRVVPVTATGANSVSVVVDSSCQGSCYITFTFSVARRSFVALPVPVTISKLFDVNEPTVLQSKNLVTVVDPSLTLDVALTVEDAIIAPNTTTSITVDVDSIVSGSVVAQIAVFIVDQAWIDLLPPASVDLASALTPELGKDTRQDTSAKYYASKDGFSSSNDILPARAQSYPYRAPNWITAIQGDFYFYGNKFDVDYTDNEYYYLENSRVTYVDGYHNLPYDSQSGYYYSSVGGGGSRAASDPDAGNSNSDSGVSTDGLEVNTPVTIFRPALISDSTGKITLTFTSPLKTSTYNVRVFAITSDGKSGQKEASFVVRQPVLSLNADMPRIVRSDDQFNAGATVTVTDPSFTGSVQVVLQIDCEILEFLGPNIITVDASLASGPVEVLFALRVIGFGTLKYRISAYTNTDGPDELQDSILQSLDALGIQDAVFLADSFVLDTKQSFSEGITIPEYVPYSGDLFLQAGVGHLSGVNSFVSGFFGELNENPLQYATFYTAALSAYPSEFLYGATEGSDQEKILLGSLDLLRKASANLQSLTSSVYGLQYSSNSASYPYIDPYLNAYAIYMNNRVIDVIGNSNDASIPNSIVKDWTDALNSAITKESYYGSVDCDLLSTTFLALGPDAKVGINKEFSFNDLIARINNGTCDIADKTQAALSLQLYPTSTQAKSSAGKKVLSDTLTLLKSQTRIQAQTAYISEVGKQGVDITATILGFEVLSRDSNSLNLQQVPKIAAFIQQQPTPATTVPFWWWSDLQRAFSALALSYYDQATSSTKPNISIKATSTDGSNNVQTLLNGTFTSATDEPATASYFFEDVSSNKIDYKATGSAGEVTVVTTMRYVPSTLVLEPVYRGINVRKQISILDDTTGLFVPVTPASGNKYSFERGDQLKITIEVSSPDALTLVNVRDPLSGGIEALDNNLFIDPSTFGPDVEYVSTNAWWYRWVYSYFEPAQYFRDAVQWYASYLRPGTQVLSYTAVVVTRGDFVIPPAHAWSQLEPEVMGLSAAGFLTVNGANFGEPTNASGSTCIGHISRALFFTNLGENVDPLESQSNQSPIDGSSAGSPSNSKNGGSSNGGSSNASNSANASNSINGSNSAASSLSPALVVVAFLALIAALLF